jgi:hypothetical protein
MTTSRREIAARCETPLRPFYATLGTNFGGLLAEPPQEPEQMAQEIAQMEGAIEVDPATGAHHPTAGDRAARDVKRNTS